MSFTNEDDLTRRQRKHLEQVNKHYGNIDQNCLHNQCSECVGTGIKKDGTSCVHMISCPCPRCSPYSM